MKPSQRILQFAKPYSRYLWGSMFFNILYSVLNIFSVATMLPILGLMFGTVDAVDTTQAPPSGGGISEFFGSLQQRVYYAIQLQINEHGAIPVLAVLCAVTGFAFLLRNLFRYIGSLLLVNYRVLITRDMRAEMYNKFLQLPVAFFTERRRGDMMSRITNDINTVDAGILGSLVDLVNAPFMIIFSLLALFALSPQLTMFSLIVFPVMGWIISRVGKSLKREAHAAQHELGNLFSMVDETLRASKIIKIFNAEEILKRRFNTTSENWQDYTMRMSRRRMLASPSSEFLGSVTILLITWFAGRQIIEEHSMQPEAFLVFIGLFFQILEPAKSFSNAISSVQSGMASLERVTEVLDFDIKVAERENALPVENLKDKIEFRNVGFFYEKENIILKNFNLTIPRGKTVALVGQSGSGKSTVASLLARFYDVSEGEILIDGVNVKDLKLTDFRSLLGMVTQESVLFNDTVYNNILISNPRATEEEVVKAAKIANAHQFIESLPEKYHTNIGDEGSKLSGGQRQRLSIARAVLKNPPVMILDEATSALDTESEKFVQDALEKMMENRTSLVIAHRLSTIKKADLIVVMDRGSIVEQGTHSELLALGGIYRKLVELQNFG
ncbi:ABC transporter ATP-binding protein [Cruoricaptor ignavus]|uniref:ABC transporter ATP-binding protein n=1 Tax=Cruoricaptor ignavus TaxID=1118202 RepID=UPI00370D07C0